MIAQHPAISDPVRICLRVGRRRERRAGRLMLDAERRLVPEREACGESAEEVVGLVPRAPPCPRAGPKLLVELADGIENALPQEDAVGDRAPPEIEPVD